MILNRFIDIHSKILLLEYESKEIMSLNKEDCIVIGETVYYIDMKILTFDDKYPIGIEKVNYWVRSE